MRTLSIRLRGQRGISLLEALVSLVVLSLGLLGIAKLNAYLVATSGVAKVRSEAVALAEQKIEELRNQLVENETTTQDYASMVTSLTTDCSTGAPAGQKDTPASPLAAFTRVWCKLGTAINTQVQVSVLWTDGTGATQNVSLQSVVTWDSPLKSVAFAETGGGSAAQAFAKPPTGRAYVGKGTTTVDNSVAQMPDNLRMQHGADGYYRLVDPSGNVLLTGTGLNEQFSIITGRVYIDDGMYVTDPVSGFSANAKVATKEIFVSVSDAAYCSKIITSPISAIVDTSNASKKYKYFDYRCYIGAGWYGNVGILRVDSTQTKERVCLGDPGVSSTQTTSNTRKPALLATRMYRGYKTIASGIYESTGIGIATDASYTAVTLANHHFLLTIINGSATDTDCATPLSVVTNPSNPFTGNQGRFYCLSATCPSPLPNVGSVIVQINVSGNVTLLPATGTTTPVPVLVPQVTSPADPGVAIDSGTCTLGTPSTDLTTGVVTQPYSCLIGLTGWTGASWGGNMTVRQSGGTMCASGASGPGAVTAGSDTVVFTDQTVTDITVTQNVTVAKDAASCP